MKISFLTLFPQYYDSFKEHSIIKRAIEKKKVTLEIINIKDFALKNDFDDYVYGGGPGMLMKIEPVVKALRSVKTKDSYVILTSPKGKVLKQKLSKQFSKLKHLIIICGHYEGIDSRIKHYINQEISIGEFIVTGGEVVSVLIADSIIRLIPGVIKAESHQNESFENNLIESDHFTKPYDFEGHKVPDVLISGHHEKILKWRNESSKKNTIKFNKENKKEE